MSKEPAKIGDMRQRRAQRELLALMQNRRVGEPRAVHDFDCRKDGAMYCTCGADDLNAQLARVMTILREGNSTDAILI